MLLFSGSAFHLLAQKRCDCLRKLVLHVGGGRAAAGADKQNAAHDVALGYDRGCDGNAVALIGVGQGDAASAVLTEGAAVFHYALKLRAYALVEKLTLCPTRHGDDGVTVADGGDGVGGLVQAVAYLSGEIAQLADGGVFFEDDFPVLVGEDLQRVAFTDTHGAADLFGNDDSAEVVCLCQVESKNF